MARIAVEHGLTQVKDELSSQGHQIVSLNANNAADCDCCVVSGMDNNMMGIAETVTRAPVIQAGGLTAQQVAEQVNERMNR